MDRKNILLATEDSIEAKFEEEARKPRKPITFTATINTNFFDCAKCCGSQIVGCYTPSGVHCERPLEIGIRQDSAFASIYDESDTEIENCELLFVEQGVYLFRAYTNSHPYDTSQVSYIWICTAYANDLIRGLMNFTENVYVYRGGRNCYGASFFAIYL